MGFDTLYRERAHLAAYLSAAYLSEWCEDLENGEAWKILYVHLPTGQASWHIASIDWDLFPHVPKSMYSAEYMWDGHTTDEKYERIRELTEGISSGLF